MIDQLPVFDAAVHAPFEVHSLSWGASDHEQARAHCTFALYRAAWRLGTVSVGGELAMPIVWFEGQTPKDVEGVRLVAEGFLVAPGGPAHTLETFLLALAEPMRSARLAALGFRHWTPFARASLPPLPDKQRAAMLADALRMGFTQAQFQGVLDGMGADEIWLNNRYQVNVLRLPEGLVHLSIKQVDKGAVHDWRDLQRIKTELLGPEVEAVELYPAESRLIDTANQYHLWAVVTPGFRFPFGWDSTRVVDTEPPDPASGRVQRPAGGRHE